MSETMQRYTPVVVPSFTGTMMLAQMEPLSNHSSKPGFYSQSDVCKLEDDLTAQLATLTAENEKLRTALQELANAPHAYVRSHARTALAAALGDTTGGTEPQ